MTSHFLSNDITKFYRLARPNYPITVLQKIFDCWESALYKNGTAGSASFLPKFNKTNEGLALDVGCGSGQMTKLLSSSFSRVIASDVSESQIAEAKATLKEFNNVTIHVGDCYNLRCGDGEADLVTVAQALHWFDVRRFYAEVARCLRPGGALAAVCYSFPFLRNSANRAEADALLHEYFLGATGIGPFWDERRALIESRYTTLPLFSDAKSVRHETEMSAEMPLSAFAIYLRSQSAYAEYLRAVRPSSDSDVLRVLLDRLAPLLPKDNEDPLLQVVWPLTLVVGVK